MSKLSGETVIYTRYKPTARVLSTVRIVSIRVVVVGIENPAQNDASGPEHARVTLTRYSHVTCPKLRPRAR